MVGRALAGDVEGFTQLFRRHAPAVHTFAQRRTRSAHVADDVVSVSFEKAWHGLDQLGERHGDRFRPWVFRIAANELASMMRSLSRRTAREHAAMATGVMADQRADLFERVDASIDDASVLRVLGRLPDRYQEVISLRYLSDLTAAETAESLGISRGNVAVLLHRGIAALRREIGGEA